MSKTTKIEGIATIVKRGSACVGNMPWETPYIIVAINGERYRYQSDRIDLLDLDKDDIIKIRMLVRDNGNVWRFNLIDKYDI